jgi:hypothetical protein
MKYHDRKPKTCKYCTRPARRNLNNYGVNKGYYRTCGSEECITAQYRDKAVSARKHCNTVATCEKCEAEYTRASSRQKWCKTCAPNASARARLTRYNVSAPEFEEMKAKNNGMCPLCEKRPATVLDHSHISGRNRGALCNGCNILLDKIEDKEWLKRAIEYAVC